MENVALASGTDKLPTSQDRDSKILICILQNRASGGCIEIDPEVAVTILKSGPKASVTTPLRQWEILGPTATCQHWFLIPVKGLPGRYKIQNRAAGQVVIDLGVTSDNCVYTHDDFDDKNIYKINTDDKLNYQIWKLENSNIDNGFVQIINEKSNKYISIDLDKIGKNGADIILTDYAGDYKSMHQQWRIIGI